MRDDVFYLFLQKQLLGGFPVGRDGWGGERIVGGVLPRITIGTNV